MIGARLGLAVDEVQLSELFIAVAADASSVHFGEFVGSEATRRFFAHAVYDDEPESTREEDPLYLLIFRCALV